MPVPTLAPKSEMAHIEQDEGRAIFERATRRYLGISTEEFLDRWKSGKFSSDPELAHKASRVALLLPLLSAGKDAV